jgi:hypothetical protein
MKGNLTEECRDSLLIALESSLDTRDKRYMFLRMEFKRLVARIDLEGSSMQTAYNIYNEFEKQCMLGSLISCLNVKLDTTIVFETIK